MLCLTKVDNQLKTVQGIRKKHARGKNPLMLLLLFVSVHPQTLFAFMGRYFMSLPFFTTRHVGSYFLMFYCSMPYDEFPEDKGAKSAY